MMALLFTVALMGQPDCNTNRSELLYCRNVRFRQILSGFVVECTEPAIFRTSFEEGYYRRC